MRGPRPPNPNMRPAYQGSNPVSDVWAKHALSIVSKYLKRLENYFYTVMSFMNDLSFLYVQIIGYILVGSRLIEGDDFFFLRNILFDPAHSKTNSSRMSSKDPSLLSLVKVSSIDFNFHRASLAVFLSFSITLLLGNFTLSVKAIFLITYNR